jgi:hypothetical protein
MKLAKTCTFLLPGVYLDIIKPEIMPTAGYSCFPSPPSPNSHSLLGCNHNCAIIQICGGFGSFFSAEQHGWPV